jgi:Ca2+-binding EF-hand superfamily protein
MTALREFLLYPTMLSSLGKGLFRTAFGGERAGVWERIWKKYAAREKKRSNIQRVLGNLLLIKITKTELSELWQMYDLDANNFLDASELEAAVNGFLEVKLDFLRDMRQDIPNEVKSFRKQNLRRLPRELRAMVPDEPTMIRQKEGLCDNAVMFLESYKRKLYDKQFVHEMLAAMDTNKDGHVSKEEFMESFSLCLNKIQAEYRTFTQKNTLDSMTQVMLGLGDGSDSIDEVLLDEHINTPVNGSLPVGASSCDGSPLAANAPAESHADKKQAGKCKFCGAFCIGKYYVRKNGDQVRFTNYCSYSCGVSFLFQAPANIQC